MDSWLRERVHKPFNCNLFYFGHKAPEMRICDPKKIVKNYMKLTHTSYTTSQQSVKFKCLPACKRDHIDIRMSLSGKQVARWV